MKIALSCRFLKNRGFLGFFMNVKHKNRRFLRFFAIVGTSEAIGSIMSCLFLSPEFRVKRVGTKKDDMPLVLVVLFFSSTLPRFPRYPFINEGDLIPDNPNSPSYSKGDYYPVRCASTPGNTKGIKGDL